MLACAGSIVMEPEDVAGLSKLQTCLEELDLCMESYNIVDVVNNSGFMREPCDVKISCFSALTRLTALSLHGCLLFDGDSCAALGYMTRLRKLHLESCALPLPEELWKLSALTELCMHAHCCAGEAEEWWDVFQLPVV